MHAPRLYIIVLTSIFFSSTAFAQVFNDGPSDSSQFSNVIDVPGDFTDVPSDQDSRFVVGGASGETTQLNIANGGSVGDLVAANSGTEVNISGGSVGDSLTARSGSEVNITGGVVGTNLRALSGSLINISGGDIGASFQGNSLNADPGSVVNITGGSFGTTFRGNVSDDITISGGNFGLGFEGTDGVELIGGEFELNGQAFTGSSVSLGEAGSNDIFTGTLADGSSFIFFRGNLNFSSDFLNNVNLVSPSQPLPAASLVPEVVTTPVVDGPQGLRAGQSLTVQTGGELGRNFAVVDATLNVDGGVVGRSLEVAGGEVNITGGVVGRNLDALMGSVVNISGGEVGRSLTARPGSEVNISGGDVGGMNVQTGSELNISGGSTGFSADDGSTVNITGGGLIRFLAGDGSVINISGGEIAALSKSENGSVVNFSGGSLARLFRAEGVVNITGGEVVGDFTAADNSQVDISGGLLGRNFRARDGSEVNITGGSFGESFVALDGSEVNISGGDVATLFNALDGSDVELIGGEFKLNGEAFTGSTITLGADDVFTGTLADGSSFIFSDLADNVSGDLTLTSSPQPLPVADQSPIVVATPVQNGPKGLRAGQSLTLQAGGELAENFAVVDATLNVEGGTVSTFFEAARSTVNISGGELGNVIDVYDGSVLNISGGSLGNSLRASDSEVNITGGSVGPGFQALSSVVNISDGSVSNNFSAGLGSVVNINGGTISDLTVRSSDVTISGGTLNGFLAIEAAGGGPFGTIEGSNVDLLGSDFALNGTPIDGLVVGEAFTINERDVTLSGLLADGSPFSFDLNTSQIGGQDFIASNATLRVTVAGVLEPLLGDVNLDNAVDFLDIAPFITRLVDEEFQAEADIDGSGTVDFLDIAPFIAILTGG